MATTRKGFSHHPVDGRMVVNHVSFNVCSCFGGSYGSGDTPSHSSLPLNREMLPSLILQRGTRDSMARTAAACLAEEGQGKPSSEEQSFEGTAPIPAAPEQLNTVPGRRE